ncbi:MAG: histidinol-phosphate transaminase [Firmicutes bacterium]|nr:histidinol-phosphate transaminase [Bacillota bacterium]
MSMTRRPCLEKITPYQPGKPIEEVKREMGLQDVVKMASNENPLGPSPLALEAIKEHLPRINYYPDGSCYYLKKALAKHLSLKENSIIVGNGADELITLVSAAYLNPGEEIIMAHPSFSEYEFAAQLMDARTVRIDCQDFRHDLEAMAAAVNDHTKLIMICNPNNPTGTIITHEELEDFLKKLPRDILVVIDEAYFEYVTDPSYPRSLELLAHGYNILILRTFSKVYGLAGLRIGYGLAREDVIADLNTVRAPFNVNSVAQVAARAALLDQEHVQAVLALNNLGREFLSREFERMGLFYLPTEANFFFVEVKVDAKEVFSRLLSRGIIIRVGNIFGFPQFIRLSIATEEQNARFIKVLEEILKEMRST